MMKTPRLESLWPLWTAKNPEEQEITYSYDALTPTLMEEEDARHYAEALNFACHKPDIRNIAVTGPYGAGKSSVLLTWTRSRKDRNQIMTVSLADFDMARAGDVSADKNGEDTAKSERKARQEEKSIEYSILQQILYKARKSDLPYSRIDRIADFTPSQVWAKAFHLLGMSACCLSGLMLLFPHFFRKKLSLPVSFSEYLLSFHPALRTGLAGVAFFITFYLLISKLHRMGIFDRRLSIDKIDISKGATLSARPADPSLLNVFIDEIVYFFDKQNYKIVIFEDLDRHNDGAIFIKLREINQIINNSLSDGKPVRFIYAVRDDIFNSPEARTKFFDFIVPVVPVMDSQNATDHFSKKFNDDDLKVPGFEQCVARIAVFITDMRLLNSIANEFRLYRKLVNNGEDIIRLLSLIAYKNLCARDYHQIDAKQGVLYGVMSAYVSGELAKHFENEAENETERLNVEISEINNEPAVNKQEIIREILRDYISDKTRQQLQFTNSYNSFYTLDEVINKEEVFINMVNSQSLSIRTIHGTTVVHLSPAEITQMRDEYTARCELLASKTDGKLTALKLKKDSLKQQMYSLETSTPEVLILKMGSTGFIKWVSENLSISRGTDEVGGYEALQYDFIYSLLRWGYLSTDYMSYRSVFIPGRLSISDNEFIIAVTAGKDFDITTAMPLDRVSNVVEKLRGLGVLHQDNAWHAGVLQHLLSHDRTRMSKIMDSQLDDTTQSRLQYLVERVFSQWSVPERVVYVMQMTSDSTKTARFVKQLYLSEKNVAVKLLILFFCRLEKKWETVDPEINRAITEILSEGYDIPDRVPAGFRNQFVANLKNAQIQLPLIGQCVSEQGDKIVREIAEHKLWAYSEDNFQNIILSLSKESGIRPEQFLKKPLTAVRETKIRGLDETIQENIEQFIRDFILGSEDFDSIPDLLNNENVGFPLLSEITRRMDFFVEDIKKINNRTGINPETNDINTESSVHELLFKYNRISPTWDNVFYLAQKEDEDKNISPELAIWFDRNHTEFNAPQVPLAEEHLHLIFTILFNSQAMSEEGRVHLLKLFGFPYSDVPTYLHLDSMRCLIDQKLLNPSLINFDVIRQRFADDVDEDELTPLLAGLIFQNPSLLQDPAQVMITDDGFDRLLAERLFAHGLLTDEVQARVLEWLWSYDIKLFDDLLFMSPLRLAQLAPHLADEGIRLALLIRVLETGKLNHQDIVQILRTFTDENLLAFISDKEYRRIGYSDSLWELASQLEAAGFIRKLKWDEKYKRIRFVPHNRSVFMTE
ncbi:hypothetical protein TH60_21340 [Pantoea ananatis]|uniref:YobI family P-loop NTPase n=1 Tax=Pantoea ananas TaxID=553 RepID=UPI00234FE68B|nr:pcar [Pantoea ananatis]MDC7872039.1 hypothetical protein [Pantoea ananatis]